MAEISSFNLWDKKWIYVLDLNCQMKLVSLFELFRDSNNYKSLAGETETQNAAILRFLLAILHTVFSHMDEKGHDNPITVRNARSRWKTLWDMGEFPTTPIINYCNLWKNRFDILSPDFPFYQVPETIAEEEKYTKLEVSKLNGEIIESNNQSKLFLLRSGNNKKQMTIDEGSRWLIYLQSYDDRGKLSINHDIGWLGHLGLIYAVGNNLFETLMLNLIFLRDGIMDWGECKPTWENEVIKLSTDKENCKITFPDNPAELYTMQSRRLKLHINSDGLIDYFYSKGGDYFSSGDITESFVSLGEQMTLFTTNKTDKQINIFPKRHDKSVQIWREFSSIIAQLDKDDENKISSPGIVKWIAMIQPIIGRNRYVHFRTVGIEYKKPFYSVITQIFSDTLDIHSKLFEESSKKDRKDIIQEIKRIEEIANTAIIHLSDNLNFSLGIEDNRDSPSDNKNSGYKKIISDQKKWTEYFFFKIDIPFRLWLQEYIPQKEKGNIMEIFQYWRNQSRKIALSVCNDMICQAGKTSTVGHKYQNIDKIKNFQIRAVREKWYSAAECQEDFFTDLKLVERKFVL